MPKNELDRGAARRRVELVAAAEANVQAATAQLESALGNMLSTGIDHPVIEELRDTVTAGRRILARAREIAKRLPLAVVLVVAALTSGCTEHGDSPTCYREPSLDDACRVTHEGHVPDGFACEDGAPLFGPGYTSCWTTGGRPGDRDFLMCCKPDPDGYTPTPTPAIDWSDWGAACAGSGPGDDDVHTCRSLAGERGFCQLDLETCGPDGEHYGTCEPPCFPSPPFESQCPAGSAPHDDGQGCVCRKKTSGWPHF